ncbi:AMP-dependent synthetase and ligase [Nitritalea halalkaliphila LW7]|uniref:AMP-dependent synthetase and ligase n=1 Tax=Nitritalea halalkaliphila LW7 TaxID=1189621 RepID=I5BTE3_9BACT|nr:acetate--CoA ligase [Nitritalea halalkaliphila]EIM72845.1 AMP-dependent synthetase and ligase [Nitritalea halalkaliphila LW7]
MTYQHDFKQSVQHPEEFWREKATAIKWFQEPKQILTQNAAGFYRWFEGGQLNTAYLCLDYHIEQGRGDQDALIYDSPVTDTIEKFTYRELRDKVAKFAGVLAAQGVGRGDAVVIYMPMIPEAVIGMLACARLGAIHSVVFGGFAPHELAVRIDDARPKVILSASCGIEFERILPYKPLVDKALREAQHQPNAHIMFVRSQQPETLDGPGEVDWAQAVEHAEPVDPVPVDAHDPLYILYTSGTTGKPKGIIRDNGGHAVMMKWSLGATYDTHPGEVFWAASDIGWAVGHSYIVYAPLINGCTTILFEGKPIRTPDAGTFWRVIAQHKVKTFFTAPTAIRAVKKEDFEGKLFRKYDVSSLKYLFVAGERCDPATYDWASQLLGIPVIDHWWQTESGAPMLANMAGYGLQPIKRGAAATPVPGFQMEILGEDGSILGPGEEGYVTIKLPLPPGCLPTLWGDDARFQQSYLNRFPGYYLSGDGGYKDADNYFYIMGRVDDVINVAGHRLSTGEMEEMVAAHPAVAECAVVGIADELKGQRPVGLVVLKDGVEIASDVLEAELVADIRAKIGAVAFFKTCIVVKRLPKTRSGKILRKNIRMLADGVHFETPSTIDDPSILQEIKETLAQEKVGLAFV